MYIDQTITRNVRSKICCSHIVSQKWTSLLFHLSRFFFFFLHNKIFSFTRSPWLARSNFASRIYIQLLTDLIFFPFFSPRSAFFFINQSSSKKNLLFAKRSLLLQYFYNTVFLMYAHDSNLKRTASACFTYNNRYIYIYYITSIFLCTLKLDSKLHRVHDGVLLKRHEWEIPSLYRFIHRYLTSFLSLHRSYDSHPSFIS